jgi:magnesium chelatase family protein
MLARRLTTILPAMTLAEAIETTRIHSVAGLTGARTTSCASRSRRVSYRYNVAGMLDLATPAALAGLGQTPKNPRLRKRST